MMTVNITKEKIKEYLGKGKRFDERGVDEFRKIEIEKGISMNAEGSARVKIGETDVIVGVKMEVGQPYPDSLDKGNLMVSAEFSPLASDRFESGPPKFPATELGRIIDRGIRESKFIKLEKLCIKEGEKVWSIFIDIYPLNDDGNLLDAAGIATIAALRDATIPFYDPDREKIDYEKQSKTKLPLDEFNPLSITVYKIGNSFLVDPTREEEDIVEARMTVCSDKGIIYAVQKGESGSLKIDEVNLIIDKACQTQEKIKEEIERFLN